MFDTLCKMAQLTAECQDVIGLRTLRMASGGTPAMDEMQLMWSEKTEAALRYGPPFLTGGSLSQMVDDYRGVVQANVQRLSASA